MPLLLEELELDGVDARDVDCRASMPERARRPPTSSSSAPACRGCSPASAWARPGIPFTIIEKNPGVGGTWCENRYPGCRVDVGNHFYCYSFAPNNEWTEFFARQPELQALLRARRPATTASPTHIRFDTEVTAARWDEATGPLDGHGLAAPTAAEDR